jgi:predicted DNA-binding protein
VPENISKTAGKHSSKYIKSKNIILDGKDGMEDFYDRSS